MPVLRNAPEIRYSELLRALRDLLAASTALTTILGGSGRVWLDRSRPSAPPWREREQGGGVIVRTMASLWPTVTRPHEPRGVGVMFRADFNDIPDRGYDVGVALEAALAEVHEEVNAWAPAADAFDYVRVVSPFTLWSPPEPAPRYEESEKVYFNSSVYRALVTYVP